MRIVLDTNVLVSGLMSPHGPPGRIVDLVVGGEITLILDDRILSEYREVLQRPRFHFRPADVDALLVFIRRESEIVVALPLGLALPDPGDVPFLEVAVAGDADALVTGNIRHFKEWTPSSLPLETPAELLERFVAASG